MLNAICNFLKMYAGVEATWQTAPEGVQRIYYANHTSHIDCILLLSALPLSIRKLVRPVAAADYWTATPLRSWFSQQILKIIPIARFKLTRANNPIAQIVKAIDEGSSLIIFPEGGRNTTADMQQFKSGLYHLCRLRPDVELVPAYIDNARRILPKGEIIPVPLKCSVTFGQPIRLLPNESREAFLERAREAVLRCAA
jgi:1-acyl-sn-glycerol-3-phosphate acyltransferase